MRQKLTRLLTGSIVAVLAIAASVVASETAKNYFAQPDTGTIDNTLVINGTWKVDDTAVDVTGAELNRAADVSTRVVAAGGTLAATVAAHDGRTIALDTAAGSTVTLPACAAADVGARLRFQVTVTATSNSHIVKVANASDIIQGVIVALSDDAGAVTKSWEAGASDDTITLNRTTTGTAKIGHFLELECVKANTWGVHGTAAQSGTEATPFSATVS